MTTAPTAAPPERVVLLLYRTSGVTRANGYAEYVSERGVEVQAVVADGQGWRRAPRLHPSIDVYSLGRAENRLPLLWAYVALVERLPGGLLRRLQGRVPGAGSAARVHRKVAGKLRKHVFWRVYRPLRHQVLTPVAVRRLGRLDLAGAARVICMDEAAIPLGWAIAKRYPGLEVTRAADRRVYEDRPVAAPDGPPAAGSRRYATL
ncbi:hypothetical protein LO763_08815 [Glycomyces sp. A-F 0318]|uniref:hypothetical protein n=1 Tax=Glycomyces amatae TaxID=2881355 RepID=UPI001E635671|nr:hypothetical protein [Glycomyces amatae]MCD0443721.1 hypothetical protein [Glycomyces amatae]